jgi:putative phosphoesterase
MTIGQTVLPNSTTPTVKPTKIVGLISDTHIPARASVLPKTVEKAFSNVDFIIHAGDLVELRVVDELEQIAPVLAVRGNMDMPDVAGAFPSLNSLRVMNWKIGVIHDSAQAGGVIKTREFMTQNQFDVLVSGHTHTSSIRWEEKTLFINPGSPVCPEPPFLCKPTVAVLKITKDVIVPEIIEV